MITGAVTSELEAQIQLAIRGASGREQILDAVIDTGFNGHLTLPPDVVAAFGLPRVGHAE